MGAVSVKPTTLKLDEETKDRVRRLADVRQRSAHWILLEAVHQYVEREEKESHSVRMRWRHGPSTKKPDCMSRVVKFLHGWIHGVARMKRMHLYATGNFYGKGVTGFKTVKRLFEKQSAGSSETSGFNHSSRH